MWKREGASVRALVCVALRSPRTDRVICVRVRGGLNAFFAVVTIAVDPLALLAFGVDGALLINSFNVARALEVVLLAHLVSVAWSACVALRAAQY